VYTDDVDIDFSVKRKYFADELNSLSEFLSASRLQDVCQQFVQYNSVLSEKVPNLQSIVD
jgi:hypothetical protein